MRHLDLLLEDAGGMERFKKGGAVAEVAAALKRLSMRSAHIRQLLADLEYPETLRKYLPYEADIRKVRALATDTPIGEIVEHANSAHCSASVREGIIQIATDRSELLDKEIQALKLKILKAQVYLNRA
jgi:uncharacterized membrane protein YccC